jgi:sulfur dioxygenase
MILRQLIDYETFTYTYLIADKYTKKAIIIDPVREQFDRDLKLITELGLDLKYCLETHVHADHVTSANSLRESTGCKTVTGIYADIECSDIKIKDGETLNFGKLSFRAIATPGHTNTCMSYLVQNLIFTGDALFIRGTGRTDFQGGSADKLYDSISRKLFSLAADTIVCPGHDYKGMTSSTIGEEKLLNPRINSKRSKEDFIDLMSNLKLAQPKKIQEAVPANIQCGKKVGV